MVLQKQKLKLTLNVPQEKYDINDDSQEFRDGAEFQSLGSPMGLEMSMNKRSVIGDISNNCFRGKANERRL